MVGLQDDVELLAPGSETEELFNRPHMIRQVSGHSRCRVQSGVSGTKVVDHTHPEHGGFDLRCHAGRTTRATTQGRQPGAKAGVQPLDVGGVEPAQPDLRHVHNRLGSLYAAVHRPTLDRHQPASGIAFDDLHDVHVRPADQPRLATLARAARIAKDVSDHGHIRREAIHSEQQRLSQPSSGAHLHQDAPNQAVVAAWRNHAPDEQAREYTHRRRHPPPLPALPLHIRLVGLHLSQFDLAVTHDGYLHPLGMVPSLLLLVAHRSLIFAHPERTRTQVPASDSRATTRPAPASLSTVGSSSHTAVSPPFRQTLCHIMTRVAPFCASVNADAATLTMWTYNPIQAHRQRLGLEHTPVVLPMRSLHAIL